MGDAVTIRVVIAIGVSVGLSACANEHPTAASFAATPIGMPGMISSASAAPASAMPKKTMTDRVLAAMALERVTGMKPDPARLVQ